MASPDPRPIFRAAALFRPGRVLLCADPSLPGTATLRRNLKAGGFRGELFMAERIEDAPAPDLAVLNLTPDRLGLAMRRLAAAGCAAAVVTGPAPDLAALSAETGIRALGAGSFGLCVPGIGLDASLAHCPVPPGRLALVSQSAAITRAVLDWAASASVGFTHVIGVGSNAGTGFAAALDWLAQDPLTGAILLDLRRIRDRRRFVSAARAAARTRPVVAIAAGLEPEALRVLEAALRRAGVLLTRGLGDLLGAAETLARTPPRRRGGDGGRLAVVANGGGLARLAVDAMRAEGLRFAPLSPEGQAALAMVVPGAAAGQPAVLGPDAGARLAEAAVALASLPEVDTVVALHAPSADPSDAAAAPAMAATAPGTRLRGAPVLVAWAGGATAAAERHAMEAAGLAVFGTPEAALRGAAHLAQDRRNRAAAAELPPREVLALAPDRAAVARLFAAARVAGEAMLSPGAALSVLAAYGVPTAPWREAAGPEEAAAAAAALGFPVVLKRLARGLPHKTALGGVAFDLHGPAAVRAAAAAMIARLARERPDVALDGFLVQRQAGRAAAVALRLSDDPTFGPWIGLLPGGDAADLAAVAIELPPLNRPLAAALIERSATLPLLDGRRGREPADRVGLADALVRLSQIAVDWPEIAELSVDPLFVDGAGVLAVDARLRLRPPGERALLAIAPYPGELSGQYALPAGGEVTVRPIRPEDAAAHLEAFARVRPEDVRFRFFAPLRQMSPELAARLTQIDYDREMAFVAVRARPGLPDETVGAARLVRGPEEDGGEFAVLVGDAVKGQGLGRHLMRRLTEWARAAGLRRLHGQVLADNTPMLAFVRALGFTLHRVPGEEGVLEARLILD